MKYVCQACGFVYDEDLGDPERGIKPGTKFEDLPDDYKCAWCGAGKVLFAAQQLTSYCKQLISYGYIIKPLKTAFACQKKMALYIIYTNMSVTCVSDKKIHS